ncbi:hypothetical protein BDZ91DRAFT_665565 [Kalaharituber pfeilii]|nr:hypothetical protein BDZ91DRAFT_665565 [Kalaharituber pfeilii]
MAANNSIISGGKGAPDIFPLERIYRDADGLRQAEVYLEREIRDLDASLGPENPLGIEIKRRLVIIKCDLGKFEEAEAWAWKVKRIDEVAFGPGHPTTAGGLSLLAKLCRVQNKFRQAEKLALEAKEIFMNTVGLEETMALVLCNELVQIYIDCGKIREAEREARKLTETLKRLRHPTDTQLWEALQLHAVALESLGRWEEAQEVRKQVAQEDCERTDLEKHPIDLWHEHDRGWYLMRQGEYKQAEIVLSNVLKQAKERLRPDDIIPRQTMRNLAIVYRHLDRFPEAEAMQVVLSQTVEELLGLEHEETLNVLFDLARTYQMQGKLTKAIELQLKVRAGREKVLGRWHEATISSIRRLVELYTRQGKIDEAELALQAAIEGDIHRLGLANEETILAAKSLAVAHLNNQNYGQAGDMFSRVKIMYDETVGPQHEETLGSLSNIGYAYLCQGRFKEAEVLLLKAKEDMDKYLPPNHPYNGTTANHLYNLYQSQGRILEALMIVMPKNYQSGQLESPALDEDEEAMLAKAIQLSLAQEES